MEKISWKTVLLIASVIVIAILLPANIRAVFKPSAPPQNAIQTQTSFSIWNVEESPDGSFSVSSTPLDGKGIGFTFQKTPSGKNILILDQKHFTDTDSDGVFETKVNLDSKEKYTLKNGAWEKQP